MSRLLPMRPRAMCRDCCAHSVPAPPAGHGHMHTRADAHMRTTELCKLSRMRPSAAHCELRPELGATALPVFRLRERMASVLIRLSSLSLLCSPTATRCISHCWHCSRLLTKGDMDLRLLALLLLCSCRQGSTDLTTDAPGTPSPSTPAIQPAPTNSSQNGQGSLEKVEEEEEQQDKEKEKEKEARNCTAQQLSLEAKRVVGAAIMKLGLQLLENLKTGPEQPNVIISPLSISLALSQLALGAENETEHLLLKALKVEGLACYHQSLRGLLQHLRSSATKVATRIYLRPGFQVKRRFIQRSLRMYDSEPVPLAGVEEINQWVEKATDGHMTDILTSLPADLVILLINAVHFKGEWVARFDPNLTGKDRFYIDSKNIVHVQMMMAQKYPLSILMDSELGAQVARFPFKENMSLLVVMPMSGVVNVSSIAAKLNTSDLYARLPSEKTMKVKLPKFKLEYSQELDEALKSIGLGILFKAPNLSGISDSPLVVSSVLHKSSMELHEKGAEASAATAVLISRSIPSFSVNQPFLFALMDDVTQTPIFLGVITNPDPGATAMQNDDPEHITPPDHKEYDSSYRSAPK
ncbi:hypothetical protein AAFF_G00175430 [Aldrovandia affinis]|uniref:Serpin domain-containing protein n=1 Tax=Aldrovandia affinis TaxID=143900 RepID=A0AAD7RLB2_9TELE|nr:hypothetical protein AAFF_G00175430 [Aldrovandia affinis]